MAVQRVGPYEVTEEIARGSLGAVFRARARAQELQEAADSARRKGDRQRAIELLDQALELDPGSAGLWLRRAS